MPPRPSHAAAAVALVAVVAAVACAPAISGRDIEAARTEARVKTALVNDPVIGTRVINVRMVGGIAQLSGRVLDQAEAARAAEVARAVSGVTDVDLRLQVGEVPPDVVADAPRADPSRGAAYELAELEDRPGLLGIGGGIGWANQPAPAGTRTTLQPLVKIGSATGLGPVVAFEWFDRTVVAPTVTDAPVDGGALTLRPVMAGVGYTMPFGRLSVTASVVAGYAFNSLRVPEAGGARGLPVDVTNSVVWRPGLAVWIDTSRRTSLNLSLGRAFTRPRVTFVDDAGLVDRNVRADTTVLLAGLVYRLF
jgi:hyperosmotically inducible protein